MSARELVNEQTRIRHAMLANGYVPLANKEKMTLIKGWSTLKVDKALIEEWSEKLAYQSTGLRIDAPLVAIDVDIDDREIVEALWDWATETWGASWAKRVMIRFGSGAKECWVCQIDEPFRVPPGPKFVRPEDDPEDPDAETHKVELFGGISGRQIGSYGWHTTDVRRYEWAEDKGPAEVPLNELPVLSKADLFKIDHKYAELLEKAGWHRVLRYKPEEWAGVEKVYDIPAGLVVHTHQRGQMPVEELREGDRVRMAEVSGTGTNTTRGLARITHEGVAIWDSETGVTHCLESAAPKDIDEQHNALADKLLAVLGPKAFEAKVPKVKVAGELGNVQLEDWDIRAGVEQDTWAGMEQLVKNLQHRYAHFPSGSKNEEVVDMFTGVGYRKDAFLTLMGEHSMDLPTGEQYAIGPKAGEDKTKMVNPVTVFLAHKDTVRLAGYRFDPDTPARRIIEKGRVWLNLYEPPDFGDLPPDPDAGRWFGEFLEYLVPDEGDRAWLLNWIAHKVRNPGQRGAGVILVTPTQGTGRNVLMKMLQVVLGDQWCRDVPAGVLLGTSGQSQYDDGMINTILLTCDEIAMDGASYDRRLQAYERLKAAVDPFRQKRSLNRKGLSMIEATVCYSTLMASNHPYDALPLAKGDRRFAVIHCTREPFAKTPGKEHIKAIVDRVLPIGRMANMAALSGLREALMALETDAEAFTVPPLNGGKLSMIEANEGDVEKVLRQYLEKMPAEQPCFWFADMVARCEDWLDKKPQVRQHFERNARKLLQEGFEGWTYDPNARFRVGTQGREAGTHRRIVVRDGVAHVTPSDRFQWLGDGPKRGD
jgi:hypothetical protein